MLFAASVLLFFRFLPPEDIPTGVTVTGLVVFELVVALGVTPAIWLMAAVTKPCAAA